MNKTNQIQNFLWNHEFLTNEFLSGHIFNLQNKPFSKNSLILFANYQITKRLRMLSDLHTQFITAFQKPYLQYKIEKKIDIENVCR